MATSRAQSLPSGITKLIKVIEHLNNHPQLTLSNNVKSLRLTLAYQNDHWGARHFIKESLPRIRYANPDLEIDVIKWRKEKNEHWKPELEVKFDDGLVKIVDMDAKPSSSILQEVMSIAGSDPWKMHVEEAKRTGIPIVPGEPQDTPIKQPPARPNLWEFRKANPQKEMQAEQIREERKEKKEKKARTSTKVTDASLELHD